MASKPLPAQDVLHQLLSYDPETGMLTWNERDVSWFREDVYCGPRRVCATWNARYAGKPAINHISANGYREGPLLGQRVKAHRIIWKMMMGDDPDQVDHINGDRADNRWTNLRDGDQSQNQRNAARRNDNSTGVVGVSPYRHERRRPTWVVKIGDRHVGYFTDFEAAISARRAAEREHGFHPNHGRTATT